MKTNPLYLVVMAGGSGTRFWPKSTSRKPKQLLSFGKTQAHSLLQQTIERFKGLVSKDHQMVVTTQILESGIAEQAGGIKILAEPQGRNTAPCIYWAARAIAEQNPDAVMLIMPSDHYIADPASFCRSVEEASAWAVHHDDLVTLGIKPSRPETGYGYLRTGTVISGNCRKVEAFVEKPNLTKAEEFIRDGNYLWNGGMFIWRVSVILNAFDLLMPEMKKAWDESHGKVVEAYPKMTATSIDYGIMEKARNVVTYSLDCGWDDLGSWTSLESMAEVLHARQQGDVVTGGEVISVESSGNIIDAHGKVVALLGVQDLIIVHQGGTILVAQKDRAQDIKVLVEAVKKSRPDLV